MRRIAQEMRKDLEDSWITECLSRAIHGNSMEKGGEGRGKAGEGRSPLRWRGQETSPQPWVRIVAGAPGRWIAWPLRGIAWRYSTPDLEELHWLCPIEDHAGLIQGGKGWWLGNYLLLVERCPGQIREHSMRPGGLGGADADCLRRANRYVQGNRSELSPATSCQPRGGDAKIIVIALRCRRDLFRPRPPWGPSMACPCRHAVAFARQAEARWSSPVTAWRVLDSGGRFQAPGQKALA